MWVWGGWDIPRSQSLLALKWGSRCGLRWRRARVSVRVRVRLRVRVRVRVGVRVRTIF